jgi:hypothetical protein
MEQSDISTMQGGRIWCFFSAGEKVTNDPQPSAEPGHVTNYFIFKLNSDCTLTQHIQQQKKNKM